MWEMCPLTLYNILDVAKRRGVSTHATYWHRIVYPDMVANRRGVSTHHIKPIDTVFGKFGKGWCRIY